MSRLNHRGHRALRLGHAPISPVGVNLVAAEFCDRQFRCQDDGAARCVDFNGMLIGARLTQEKERLKHLDDVVIRVLIVVEQHDVIQRNALFELGGFDIRRKRGITHTPAMLALALKYSDAVQSRS